MTKINLAASTETLVRDRVSNIEKELAHQAPGIEIKVALNTFINHLILLGLDHVGEEVNPAFQQAEPPKQKKKTRRPRKKKQQNDTCTHADNCGLASDSCQPLYTDEENPLAGER